MIGDVVRAERERRGWTQQDLSLRTGLAQSYVSRLEKNLRPNPSAGVLKRLADALEIPIDKLVQESGLITTSEGLEGEPVISENDLVRLRTVWALMAPDDRELLLQLAYKLARASSPMEEYIRLIESASEE